MSTVVTTGLGMLGRAPKVSGLKKPRPLRRQISSPDEQTDMKPPLSSRSISVPADSLCDEFEKITISTDSNHNEMLCSNNPNTNVETVTECNNNILKQSLNYPQVNSRRSSMDSSASDLSVFQRPTTVSYEHENTDNVNNIQCDNSSCQPTPHQRDIFNNSNLSSMFQIPAYYRHSSSSSLSSDPQENQLSDGSVLQYVYDKSDGKIVRKKRNSLTNGEMEESKTLKSNCEDASKASQFVVKNAPMPSNSVISSKPETLCESSNQNVKGMWASAQQTHKARVEEMQTKLGCFKPPDPFLLQKQIQLSHGDFDETETPNDTASRSSNDELGPSYTSIINVDGEKLVLASRCLKTLMKAANKICQMKGTHMIKVESTEGPERPPPRKTVPKPEKRFAPVPTRPHNVGQGDGLSMGNGLSDYSEQKFAWQILDEEFDTHVFNSREGSCYHQDSTSVENLRQYSDKKLLSLSRSPMARIQPKNWIMTHHAFPDICLLNEEEIYFDPFDLKGCSPEAVMTPQPGVHRGYSQPASRNFLSLNRSNNANDEEVEKQLVQQVDKQDKLIDKEVDEQ